MRMCMICLESDHTVNSKFSEFHSTDCKCRYNVHTQCLENYYKSNARASINCYTARKYIQKCIICRRELTNYSQVIDQSIWQYCIWLMRHLISIIIMTIVLSFVAIVSVLIGLGVSIYFEFMD